MNNQEATISRNEKYVEKVAVKGKDFLTFFTPTYNRATFLPRIEECLRQQTCKDFVWIIVNDGSKDNTDEVAGEIVEKNELPVMFISKPNGGKHSAFRAAFEQCETTYFQCMDDDDIYFPEAVEFFLNKWKEIKKEGIDGIGAIRTLARHPDGSYSVNFKVEEGEEYDASTIETNYIMKRRQENWTCYDAAKLRSVALFKSYWMSDCHKFVAESIWQTRFARKYKCRYVNKAFREYRSDAENRLSGGEKSRQHYLDLFLNEKVTLDEQIDLISKYSKGSLLRRATMVNCLRDYLDISYSDLMKHTDSKKLRCYYRLSWLPSLFGKSIIKFAIKHRR